MRSWRVGVSGILVTIALVGSRCPPIEAGSLSKGSIIRPASNDCTRWSNDWAFTAVGTSVLVEIRGDSANPLLLDNIVVGSAQNWQDFAGPWTGISQNTPPCANCSSTSNRVFAISSTAMESLHFVETFDSAPPAWMTANGGTFDPTYSLSRTQPAASGQCGGCLRLQVHHPPLSEGLVRFIVTGLVPGQNYVLNYLTQLDSGCAGFSSGTEVELFEWP